MPMIYNFQEIYEIGIQIERNGLAFYRRFAESVESDAVRELLLSLADWEVKHTELFERLRLQLAVDKPEVALVEPNSEAAAYLRTLADSHVFLRSFDIEDLSKQLITPKQVLEKALQFEKDSVIFYQSLFAFVPDSLGLDAIKKLAEEEMVHVNILIDTLAKL